VVCAQCPINPNRINGQSSDSKADPVQRAGNELFFPPRLHESKVNGAKECIENWFNDYPVPTELQHVTPLFRTVRKGPPRQFTRSTFLSDFKYVCRRAMDCTGTELRYEQWGTHTFRVGGMNALQDAGASVAEIMALGHWRSDAWLLYSRRSRPRVAQAAGISHTPHFRTHHTRNKSLLNTPPPTHTEREPVEVSGAKPHKQAVVPIATI
jgi:hypothetical protein